MMRGKHLNTLEAARAMLTAPNCALYKSALNPSVVSRLIKLGWASSTGASVMLLPAGREAAERKLSAPADNH
jgi:hypothetical protein